MVIGILLGNFVPNTGPALQKGKFVGVSVPIGKSFFLLPFFIHSFLVLGRDGGCGYTIVAIKY